ncbi:MAG: hypothetical protein KBT06_12235, partial [Prevotellaceae bacterium]|nr:hypothetical protein [Candidatus Colivivens equi]
MLKIAIISVNYNRLHSLKRQLISLENAFYPEEVTLIISIDKSNTEEVENFADEYVWKFGEKRVVKHEENLGLRNHMLSLGKYFDEFEALIILEDDIIVAQSYYLYAKACVEKYHDNDDIAGVSLYSLKHALGNPVFLNDTVDGYDVYFIQQAVSWGEVWMKRQWKEFKKWYDSIEKLQSEKIPNIVLGWSDKSWLKYHITYCAEFEKYFVIPYKSLSTCYAEEGQHQTGKNFMSQVPLLNGIFGDFRLPNDKSQAICFDVFHEDERLYDILGYTKQELMLNLNCSLNNSKDFKYVLTPEHLNYKIVRSFALELRPIQDNIIYNVEGRGIFLYDTSIFHRNKFSNADEHIDYLIPHLMHILKVEKGY